MAHDRPVAWDDRLRKIPFGTHIPRTVYQTYRTRQLSPELEANVRHIQTLNPGWKYRFFDDEAISLFIGNEYGRDVLARYDQLNRSYGAARADLFRYLLLYRFGGVYLDIKSGLFRPLDEIVTAHDRFILSHWNQCSDRAGWGEHAAIAHVPGGEYQQWHIISAPGHPFLRAVIVSVLAGVESYRPWRHGVGRQSVLTITGPIAYTRAIFPLLDHHPHRKFASEEELGLRYSFMPDFEHQRFFPHHYTSLRVPLVKRGGLGGVADGSYARLLRARDRLAIGTYPLRRGLHRFLMDLFR
jgi:hypothetical protein